MRRVVTPISQSRIMSREGGWTVAQATRNCHLKPCGPNNQFQIRNTLPACARRHGLGMQEQGAAVDCHRPGPRGKRCWGSFKWLRPDEQTKKRRSVGTGGGTLADRAGLALPGTGRLFLARYWTCQVLARVCSCLQRETEDNLPLIVGWVISDMMAAEQVERCWTSCGGVEGLRPRSADAGAGVRRGDKKRNRRG